MLAIVALGILTFGAAKAHADSTNTLSLTATIPTFSVFAVSANVVSQKITYSSSGIALEPLPANTVGGSNGAFTYPYGTINPSKTYVSGVHQYRDWFTASDGNAYPAFPNNFSRRDNTESPFSLTLYNYVNSKEASVRDLLAATPSSANELAINNAINRDREDGTKALAIEKIKNAAFSANNPWLNYPIIKIPVRFGNNAATLTAKIYTNHVGDATTSLMTSTNATMGGSNVNVVANSVADSPASDINGVPYLAKKQLNFKANGSFVLDSNGKNAEMFVNGLINTTTFTADLSASETIPMQAYFQVDPNVNPWDPKAKWTFVPDISYQNSTSDPNNLIQKADILDADQIVQAEGDYGIWIAIAPSSPKYAGEYSAKLHIDVSSQ